MGRTTSRPIWSTLTNAPYGISIPCSALTSPARKAILGHGLFGEGEIRGEVFVGPGVYKCKARNRSPAFGTIHNR